MNIKTNQWHNYFFGLIWTAFDDLSGVILEKGFDFKQTKIPIWSWMTYIIVCTHSN